MRVLMKPMSKAVLIAESNKLFMEALSATLSLLGYTVVATTSERAEVVALAKRSLPDLLIFDFNLSHDGFVGLSDLTQLKAQLPHLKILVLGFQEATNDIVEKVQQAGLDGFWSKYDNHAGFLKALNVLIS